MYSELLYYYYGDIVIQSITIGISKSPVNTFLNTVHTLSVFNFLQRDFAKSQLLCANIYNLDFV